MHVSVLMPMRNPGAFLPPAIESVLAQSHTHLELIVVDDGSTDASPSFVNSLRDPRVRLLEGPRSGIAACLNVALSSARGDIFMRCDADDVYPVHRIRDQVLWLTEHVDHGAVCGPFAMMDHRGEIVSDLGPWPSDCADDVASQLLCREFSTTLCSFAIRRSAALAISGFRPYFETAEDIDFMLRLAGCERIGYAPSVTYLYRLHGDSVTHTQPNDRRAFFESMAYAMALERLSGGSDSLAAGAPPPVPSGQGTARSSAKPHTAAAHISNLRSAMAWRHLDQGDASKARSLAWLALLGQPKSLHLWKVVMQIGLRSMLTQFKGRSR